MTLNCKGKLVDITVPKVMGILNITPDSFYDGGQYFNETAILDRVESMLNEGATFVDIGAYSSRPGARHISEKEEMDRILPVVKVVMKHFPDILLSVDTFRSRIAKACIEAGAALVNDISAGLLDVDMIPVVGQLGVPYIMMHMKGTPQNMREQTTYDDLLMDILFYFSQRIAEARSHQIMDIIIDPGFGFSKTRPQNYEILNNLDNFHITDMPILVGISRKSMISKALETSSDNALNGTTVLNTVALMKGASILRVHDVKEAVECVRLTNELRT